MKKLYLTIFLGIFLISFISATNIGTFRQGDTIQLTNYCSTADCTYANISSITYPNSSLDILDVPMTQSGNNFNYTFSNTTQLGTYAFVTCSNPQGIKVCDSDSFDITPSGKQFNNSQSISSIGLLVLIFILNIIILYVIFTLSFKNPRNGEGNIMGISLQKYIKIVLIGIMYGMIILTLNLMNAVAQNLGDVTQFAGIIGGIFLSMSSLAWVWTIGIIVWLIYTTYHDSNLYKELMKAYKDAEDSIP